MTRVKVCGLTREEDVDAAVDAGADAVGFITGMASPRNLAIARAGALMSRVPPFVTPVLVTSAQALVENSDAVKRMAPRAIQLYGSSFSPDTLRTTFRAQLIWPCSVGRHVEDPGSALAKVKQAAKGYNALLTDTYKEGQDGGTGLTSDWGFCAEIRKGVAPTPMILSGGLRPENVDAAIAAVSPFCVDVSSGVESSPGVKDHAKVKAFVAKARQTEERRVAQ